MKCPDCGVANMQGADVCDGCGHDMSTVSHLPRGLGKRILEGTIKDLKPRDAIIVGSQDSVPSVIRLMREKKSGCVLVVDGGKVRGILTERDLLSGVAGVVSPEEAELPELMQRLFGENLVFNNHQQKGGNAANIVINNLSEKVIELYESRIAQIKEEIASWKSQVQKNEVQKEGV